MGLELDTGGQGELDGWRRGANKGGLQRPGSFCYIDQALSATSYQEVSTEGRKRERRIRQREVGTGAGREAGNISFL